MNAFLHSIKTFERFLYATIARSLDVLCNKYAIFVTKIDVQLLCIL